MDYEFILFKIKIIYCEISSEANKDYNERNRKQKGNKKLCNNIYIIQQ